MLSETPNPEGEVQTKYKLQLNNKPFLLFLDIKDDSLIMTCTPIEDNPQFYYIYKCTLSSLRKMSKAFHLYKNLTEVLYLFEELNKNKLISLEIGDDINFSDNESFFSISNYRKNDNQYEFINLVIKLFVLVKEEVMIFPMEKKGMKENIKIIDKLQNDINKIYNDFNNVEIKYENKIESLKKEVKLLRNENINFKNQINELINKIEDLKNLITKNNNNKKSFNSIQDLINRVEKLEEWKNDTSFTNKNINISINDLQQIKNENQFKEKEKNINMENLENNKNNKGNKNMNFINDSGIKKKNINEKNENENGVEEEEIEVEEEVDESENGVLEKDKEIGINNVNNANNANNNIKKDENSELYAIEEEEEEDDEEEEREIINNNRSSFNFNLKFKEQLIKSFVNQSSIIKNSYEIDFIIDKIMSINPVTFRLLYKGTKDTDNSKSFHQKCDGIPNILLILLTNTKYIFGAYTSVGFDSSGNAKKDADAFLFSVDFQKIYEMIQDQYAIFCNKNCGPIFCGKSDGLYNICIPDKYFKNKSYTCKKGAPFNTTELFELNHGEKDFQVVELEIYKIDKY